MEALTFLFALVSLGLLALRFGAGSRPEIRSDEHRLALSGLEWDATSRPTGPTADASTTHVEAAGPVVKRLIWTPTHTGLSRNTASPFPTLDVLDRARDPGLPAFAADPNAALLERRARRLTDQYWSELAWLTGLVDQARFDMVCAALERERQAQQRIGQRVDVVVVSEKQSRIAS